MWLLQPTLLRLTFGIGFPYFMLGGRRMGSSMRLSQMPKVSHVVGRPLRSESKREERRSQVVMEQAAVGRFSSCRKRDVSTALLLTWNPPFRTKLIRVAVDITCLRRDSQEKKTGSGRCAAAGLSWRTKGKPIRKQEAQGSEFSVASFRKQCHPESPLIMRSTAFPGSDCREICVTHREKIPHTAAAHIQPQLCTQSKGRRFCWPLAEWHPEFSKIEEVEMEQMRVMILLKYEYVEIRDKVVKMSLSRMLFKHQLRYLHCDPQGKREEKCICLDFTFFYLHLIFGSVTFMEVLNNTF